MPELRARLQSRAAALAIIRDFFAQRGVLEVDTPVLSTATTPDPNLHSLTTRVACRPSVEVYLQTSPEFAMKRLLTAGSGDIYQIARAFRDGEIGAQHQPEFTLIEWYRVDWDEARLAGEVLEMIAQLVPESCPKNATHISYSDAFKQHCRLDPLTADVGELRQHAAERGLSIPNDCVDATELLDLMLTTLVAPHLGQGGPTVVFDFPASQAALAQLQPHDQRVAARFEVFLRGVELANGFRELSDAAEQRRRFEAELNQRQQRGLPQISLDEQFLAVVGSLPPCSGVALGFDRLLMLANTHERIDAVMTLPAF
jgi:lysyl-tRNA synthetase class 2